MRQQAPKVIGVAVDQVGWYRRLFDALKKMAPQGTEIRAIEIDSSFWLEQCASCDVIVWKPPYMGVEFAQHVKEKIHFLSKFLGKIVVPNFESVWHFESKVAQSYLFTHHGVRTPQTFVSFDYHDAVRATAEARFPLVLKESAGAAAQGVRMVRNRHELLGILAQNFCHQLWTEARQQSSARWPLRFEWLLSPWFWHKLIQRGLGKERNRPIYWQEFVPGNTGDIRVAVIGDRYAVAFRRKNRPGDFRASGSKLLDYSEPVPDQAILYCLELSKLMGFDSMGYDLLMNGDTLVVCEMSFGYANRLHPGYFELSDGALVHHPRPLWPQELWALWVLVKAGISNPRLN